jgi:hypothetical protein
MDSEVMFTIFKNIIIEQNKRLIRQIAKDTGRNESNLMAKYIQPEFYLPIISKHGGTGQTS